VAGRHVRHRDFYDVYRPEFMAADLPITSRVAFETGLAV